MSIVKAARDKVRVDYDREGNTLSVWFNDPQKEYVCEESDDDIVLVKGRRRRVIGFDRLHYLTGLLQCALLDKAF